MNKATKDVINKKYDDLKSVLAQHGHYKTLEELAKLLQLEESKSSALSNYNRRGVSRDHIKHIEEKFAPDGFVNTPIHKMYENITGQEMPNNEAWKEYDSTQGQVQLLYMNLKAQQKANELLEINNQLLSQIINK